MDQIINRFAEDLAGRLHGPLSFRFILQPLMAMIFACRDGMRDARTGEPAYFWSLLNHPLDRRDRIRAGWKAVSRVFVLGVLMDVIYQYLVLRTFYPMEALVTVFVLAVLPYLLIRGPIERIARRR